MTLKEILHKLRPRHDRLAQATGGEPVASSEADEAMRRVCREAAREGIVLLKNNGVLPLDRTRSTAFFGRVQNDWFYVGYGSGGDVKAPFRVSPMDALHSREDIAYDRDLADTYQCWSAAHRPRAGAWGMWPTHYREMPLSGRVLEDAARRNDCAVVFLGRAMGESMDNRPRPGWYYLTGEEIRLLDRVTAVFSRVVVVIDAGNIIDMHWTERYGDKIQAILCAFQGGMESGNAVVDILYGDASPSGKLTDTIARSYRDYPASGNFGGRLFNRYQEDIYVGYRYFETFAPERVLYPFGFGLSYTRFSLESGYSAEDDRIRITARVRNTGERSGAEVVQVYVAPPQGKLGKPLRNLVAFGKTRLLAPGEEETLSFTLDPADFASFDDTGVTGHAFCRVLEAGTYRLYLGTDVRSAAPAGEWTLDALRVTQILSSQAGPAEAFRRMRPELGEDGTFHPAWEEVPAAENRRKEDILSHLPKEIPLTGDQGIRFEDVLAGNTTLDAFIAQLDIRELDAITRGEGAMGSSFGPAGNAGMLGGTTESLRNKGIPCITTTDGPSGIRLSHTASLLPCGTALACSWNPALIETLTTQLGHEMGTLGTHILLGPGMNIHRDPMCGRNFEYYSEDPFLTGKLAAAMVRGIQNTPGHSACPKHFACNNQERMRSKNDSRLSQRALREIYLRGFQICIEESNPMTLMTSYNKVNGVWAHYHYDLVTNILRGEWGYQGLVITDWWMQPEQDPDFPAVRNEAYRVRAQVDVLMPGGFNFSRKDSDDSLPDSLQARDGLTLGEAQRCARNVLNLIVRLERSRSAAR